MGDRESGRHIRRADGGLLRPLLSDPADLRVEPLSADARLWGRDVEDERYAVVARF